MEVKAKLTISLRWFLLIVPIAAAIIGLKVRRDNERTRFCRDSRVIEGVLCQSMWDSYGGTERLVFLVVGSGTPAMGAGGSLRHTPIRDGYSIIPSGIHVDGQQVPGSTEGRIWAIVRPAKHVIVPPTERVVEIQVPASEREKFSREMFWELEDSALWRETIKPKAFELWNLPPPPG